MTGNNRATALNAPGNLNLIEVFSRIGRLPLVGRAFQQRVLDEVMGDVAGGRGRVTLLRGEAGTAVTRDAKGIELADAA